ncbi:2-methylisocitrate lyase [Kaistia algarum]|uniref:isocitrate lyase/PEP mutase family protein n=1 Tax=Kaistia algarum TaxID=2083279 RepID=UPI000CE8163A|nr:isocitrate lyase/phosphoenolpyruvate mutase family protein [Kaistia algarum]MCX5515084.1 isocitrate lyase/phosphoenolpyruvate mutase family protein [Kaistia algarum]PPE79815.1 2-methylisocitrate lyase [Kaistia algarum]
MPDQTERGASFRALHQKFRPLVVPNAYDAGTARLLTGLGFEALATTSSGLAFSLGRTDGVKAVSRSETIDNARSICAATHLPVTADLESCFADDPEGIAGTIQLAAEAGLVGGSIEDATGDALSPIYDFALAVERVHAAVEAARSLPFAFTLTARAENFLHGRPDLDDTLRRLQAFEKAGADVLYAPLVPSDAIGLVVASLTKPVNVLVSSGNADWTYDALAALGVARISIGGALARAALSAVSQAAREIRTSGTFTYGKGLEPFPF